MGKKIMKIVLTIVVTSLLLPAIVKGEPDGDGWPQIEEGAGTADGVGVDSNGDVIVTGHSPDGEHLYTVMYKKDGTKKVAEKPSEQSSLWKMFPTHPIAVDHDNNIIIVDTKYREGVVNETTEYYVVKYDNDLNFKWDETYSRIIGIYNIVTGVAVDSHNNIIVTGMTLDVSPPDFGSDYWTLKLDSEGDVIWREWGKMGITYHKDDIDMAAGVAVDSHDNVIVTGTSISMTEQTYKYSTIKYYENGNEDWVTHEEGGMALGVATDSHDNVIVIGTFETGSSIIKYDGENGHDIWRKDIKINVSDVAVDRNDNIIVTGTSNGYYTIKYDSNGDKIWEKKDPEGDTAAGVAVDNEGNIIVTGNKGSDYFTTKYTTPVAELTADFSYSPRSPTTQDTIHFTDKSYGGDPPYTYHWDFGDGSTSIDKNPTHRYGEARTYTVTLTITDEKDNTDTASKTITVLNSPPTADFSWSPSNPEVDETVTFDASSSYDPDGTITKYEWDFGDGTTDTGPTPTHSWGAPSEYRVTLRVTDNDGATDSREKPITVNAPGADAPTANFTWSPKNPKVGENVTFDASASHDPDGTIDLYEWDWDNDGIYDENYSTPIANHLITNEGYYWITLRVTDNEGNSGTTTKRIHIEISPLTADFSYSPEKPTTDDEIKFTDKSYGGTKPYTYNWSFDDGSYSNETDPTHKCKDKGTYTITLTVTDANGNTNSTSIQIKVTKEEGTPGFEALMAMAAVSIALVLLKRRKKR